MSLVGSLIAILVILLIVVAVKDKREKNQILQKNSPNYDILQHYIVTYTKAGFHDRYTFWSLYCYMIKVS